MQVPSLLQGKRLFDLITGGIVGAILITAVGFNRTGNGLRHLSMVISGRLV
jgi:hypothetical protein